MRYAVFLAVLGTAYAQSGSVAGTVIDPFGHPFSGATVQAKNTQSDALGKGVSAADGKYSITGLAAGTYDISVNVGGVRPFERKSVAVEASKAVEVAIKLQEGTQLSTLGEDPLAIVADRQRHHAPSGPTPRTVEGKPDLSGVWWSPATTDAGVAEWLPTAAATAKRRMDNNAVESPQAHCLPSPVVRLGPLFQLAQSKNSMVVISDDESPGYHLIHLDRATHPKDADSDLWYGDSIAHWEDDTLVVDRTSFNEGIWIDQAAHPHSDKLHVIEKYRRPDLGHLEKIITVEDPGVLAKPWVMKQVADLAAGEEIREFICAENNRDLPHMVGK